MKSSRWFLVIALMVMFCCGCSSSPESQTGTTADPADSDTVESPVVAETALASLANPAPTGPKMVRHGFAVLDFRAKRDEYDRVVVLGEVKNVGAGLKGVELQAVLRDEAGRLLAVGHFYPASNASIRPNETWPFAYSLGRQSEAVKAELRIVGAFRTVEILSVSSSGY